MQNELMYHIKCKKGDVGKYVILTGDPQRVPEIANFLDNPKHIRSSREYVIYTGYLNNVKVSVVSTGIGGPSTAIAIEELKMIGADTFIRIGTCGGIDENIPVGSLIIPTGAIRKEGTTTQYTPIEFPAVPNFEILFSLNNASQKLEYKSVLGIIESKDSFYGQHDPNRMPIFDELNSKWKSWKMAGALASEMECATLFIVSSVLKVRCGAVLLLCRNPEREKLLKTDIIYEWDMTPAIQVAIASLKCIIYGDE